MKRFALTVLVLILVGAVAQAQTPAAPPKAPAIPPVPGSKIATIDFRTALMESDPGKVAQQEYEKGIGGEKSKFDKLSKEMDELQTKLQNAKTETEKSTLNKDIERKTRDAQIAQEDAQRLSQDLQDKLLPPVATRVNKAVEDYSKENNLALVLDPRTDPSNIIWNNPAMDITSEIMRRMNAEYAKEPKAAATPAAPAKN